MTHTSSVSFVWEQRTISQLSRELHSEEAHGPLHGRWEPGICAMWFGSSAVALNVGIAGEAGGGIQDGYFHFYQKDLGGKIT